MNADQYDIHRRLLAGEKVDIHLNEPISGSIAPVHSAEVRSKQWRSGATARISMWSAPGKADRYRQGLALPCVRNPVPYEWYYAVVEPQREVAGH